MDVRTAKDLTDEIYEEYGEMINAIKAGDTHLGSVASMKKDRLVSCILELSTRIANEIVTERLREYGIIPKD